MDAGGAPGTREHGTPPDAGTPPDSQHRRHRPAIPRRLAIIATGAAIAVIGLLTAIIVGSSTGSGTHISGTPHVRWAHATGDQLSSPAVAGGTVYIGSADHNVYALDAASGNVRWVFATADAASSPVVAGGTVYVGSADHNVYALDAATGHVRWACPTGSFVDPKPKANTSDCYRSQVRADPARRA